MAGRIAKLSLTAIGFSVAGGPSDPGAVARWLYRFGTAPRGPATDRDFGPDDDPMAVLGLTAGGAARQLLMLTHEASTHPGWFSFARRDRAVELNLGWKLYVSPRPEALAEAFPCIASVLTRSMVSSFKVGRRIEGLLRPDKIVAYFESRAHLDEVAGTLARNLAGCAAQGVPFTADLGGDGLLSWGIDPPPESGMSWRAWVTARLGHAIVAACADNRHDPVASVLEEIRKLGVDPDRWTASANVFGGIR